MVFPTFTVNNPIFINRIRFISRAELLVFWDWELDSCLNYFVPEENTGKTVPTAANVALHFTDHFRKKKIHFPNSKEGATI